MTSVTPANRHTKRLKIMPFSDEIEVALSEKYARIFMGFVYSLGHLTTSEFS
jgi:hypothetical protein